MPRNKAALAIALAFHASFASAAIIDTYLVIPGVPGESTSDQYKNSIDISSMSVGVANHACTGFALTKRLDSASPLLSAAAVAGTIYPAMTVYVVKAGEQAINFLTYGLSNVEVTSVSLTATPTGLSESITLYPALITMTYRPQRADGTFGSGVSYSISCTKVK